MMSFDKKFDLTAGEYFDLYNIFIVDRTFDAPVPFSHPYQCAHTDEAFVMVFKPVLRQKSRKRGNLSNMFEIRRHCGK